MCKRGRNLERVSNLAAIPSQVWVCLVAIEIFNRELKDFVALNKHHRLSGDARPLPLPLREPVQMQVKKGDGFSQAQVGISKTKMNAGYDSLVQCTRTVGRKEKNSRIVLECPQEDFLRKEKLSQHIVVNINFKRNRDLLETMMFF